MNWQQRGGDRRDSIRFEVLGPLRGTAASTQHVQLRNVGPGGALIESHWPLPIGARVSLKLTPGALEDQIEARIRHISSQASIGYLVGVEFVGPDAAVHERLETLLSTIG
jgi:hypothetical protein